MPINVWDYLREYDELRDEILAAVDRVFRSGRLILGQEGIKFEREMAAYLEVAAGVGVNSGTDAIYIALAALGVKAGDEVITVPNTAVPTVSAIRTLGATPVFVDIREDDFLMDVEQVEAAITPRTTAIIPVHLYRPVRRSRSARWRCARNSHGPEGNGGLRAVARRALQEPPVGQRRPCLVVFVLSDQGAGRLWRRRYGDEQ